MTVPLEGLFVFFKVHPISWVTQVEEMIKGLSKQS